MRSKQTIIDDLGTEWKNLLSDDTEVREAARRFWEESRKDAESFPPSYLLTIYSRLDTLCTTIAQSAVQAAFTNEVLNDEKSASDQGEEEIQKCKGYPLIETHLRQVVDIDDRQYPHLPENPGLLLEVVDRLSRDFAKCRAWMASVNASWQCAVLEVEMPPFDPRSERLTRMTEITAKVREGNSKFTRSLWKLSKLIHEEQAMPIQPVHKTVYRNQIKYIRDLKTSNPDISSRYTNNFIQIAKRSKKELLQKGVDILNGLADRYIAKINHTIYSDLELSSQSLSCLLNTDFGSEWILDHDMSDASEFRESLRKDMKELFLALGCFNDVLDALENYGDPQIARTSVAPETDRIATAAQARAVEKAFKALSSQPDLRHSTKSDWKAHLSDDTESGGAVIKRVERLACSCFEVSDKGQLPGEHKGFSDGGFANLVEALYYGRLN